MKHTHNTGFAERLSTSAEAKKALLAKFQPKPTVVATDFVARSERLAAEREAVRQQRLAEREAAKAARALAEEAARQAALEAELASLEAKKSERKERKKEMKMDAQARRAARLHGAWQRHRIARGASQRLARPDAPPNLTPRPT